MKEVGALRSTQLLEAAFRLISEPGLPPPSMAELAKASGMKSKSILYWYGDLDTVCRLAVNRRVAALVAPLAWSPPSDWQLREAVIHYTRLCADLFASEDYRRLAFLLVRDGPSQPWLLRAHERDLVEPVQAGLRRIVAAVRAHGPVRLETRASGTRTFVKRLQAELALPRLMPGRKPPTQQELRGFVGTLADEALKSVYSATSLSTALGQLAAWPAARPDRARPDHRNGWRAMPPPPSPALPDTPRFTGEVA
jgi:AcrR family transcriptional regulator